jgi:hypothetical protein
MPIVLFMLIAALASAPLSVRAATADEIVKKAGTLSGSQRRSFLRKEPKKKPKWFFIPPSA